MGEELIIKWQKELSSGKQGQHNTSKLNQAYFFLFIIGGSIADEAYLKFINFYLDKL